MGNGKWTPRTVLSTLPHAPPSHTATPIPFLHLLERLKTTKREGWRQVGITTGESIADHMYRMSIMTMLAPPSLSLTLNIPRCTQMALVHDMAECLVGDFTPRNTEISKPEKSRREVETMEYIESELLGNIPGGVGVGGDIMGLFLEYEENETAEARFVHDVDKVEMLCQIIEYERRHGRVLEEFYHVVGEICLPEMREWAGAVVREREEMMEGWERERAKRRRGWFSGCFWGFGRGRRRAKLV